MPNYDYGHASSATDNIDPDNFVTGDQDINTNSQVWAINAAIIPKYTLLALVADEIVPATLAQLANVFGIAAYDVPINAAVHNDEVITGGKFNENDIVFGVDFVGGVDDFRQKLRDINIQLRAPGISA